MKRHRRPVLFYRCFIPVQFLHVFDSCDIRLRHFSTTMPSELLVEIYVCFFLAYWIRFMRHVFLSEVGTYSISCYACELVLFYMFVHISFHRWRDVFIDL